MALLVGVNLVEADHGGWLSATGGVGPLVVAEGGPPADPLACELVARACRWTRSHFRERQSRSMTMLSRQQPLPSIENRTPIHLSRSIQAKEVNCVP